jgi:hypothetical protein
VSAGVVGTLRGDRWGRLPSLGLSLVVAVLPKCSLCLMAHATLLGALGVAAVPQAWPRPVVAVSLAAALGLLAYRAPLRRGYAPFAVACVGALLLLPELTHTHAMPAGAHAMHAAAEGAHHPLATWAGIAVLMAASVWNAWPSARRNASAQEPCGHSCLDSVTESTL